MEKRVDRMFEEINRIILGSTRIPKERIRYYNEDIEIYQRYCKALMEEPQYKGATTYYALFAHFMQQAEIYSSLVGKRETQCFVNYREMLINQISGEAKYSTKVKNSIEGDFQEVLYQLFDNTREKLERYGLIKELYNRERDSLKDIGLTDIMPLDGKAIEEAVFKQDSFRFRPVPEQIAINLFWINKYWKTISQSKLALWILDTHIKNGNNEEKVTDKEKYMAIKREEILDHVQQMVTDKGGNMTFEEYIICLYGKRASLPETERLKIANAKMNQVSPELRKEFSEIEKMYNDFFEMEAITGGQLVNDCLYNLYMLKEKQNVQTIKDLLTRQLIELLIIDKASPVLPKYSSWGLAKDKNVEGELENVLFMDIPGYLKPLQVHVPQKLIKNDKSHIPIYKGVYLNPNDIVKRACSTSFLFPLTLEQEKLIKKNMKERRERYKKKPTKSEKIIIQTLEYMSAVANNEMGKLPQIIGEDEGAR